MKQLIIIVVCAIILHSCGGTVRSTDYSVDSVMSLDSIENCEIKTSQEWGNNRILDTISFFGKSIAMDDWTGILHQTQRIAADDDMLTYETGFHSRLLTIGKVKFNINVDGCGIELLSDLGPKDVKMQDVINYLNKIYGKGHEEQPDNYRWCMEEDRNNHIRKCGQVRLEPIKDGGTMVRFELCP